MNFLFLIINTSLFKNKELLNDVSDNNYFKLSNDNNSVSLRKRSAYPTTYLKSEKNNFELGYGLNSNDFENEFLDLHISQKELIIKRDIYITLPLFYSYQNNKLVLSNSFDFVVSNTEELSLNKLAITESIMPVSDRSNTIYSEINILYERQIISLDKNGLNLLIPDDFKLPNKLESDSKLFQKILEETFEKFYSKISESNFAYEVSGGIDSSTFPLYMSDKKSVSSTLISILFNGTNYTSQQEKLNRIIDITKLKLLSVQLNTLKDYPFCQYSKNSANFYNFEEIYYRPNDLSAKILKSNQIDVLVTGIGGDELFEIKPTDYLYRQYGTEIIEKRQSLEFPPFTKDKFKNDFVGLVPTEPLLPLPALSFSYLNTCVSRNNIYINQDIWPISPFANLKLYQYSQSLPNIYKANKNILRVYYEHKGWPKEIYQPQVNENFAEFFDITTTGAGFENIMIKYLSHSTLQKMDYIDIDQLFKYYLNLKNSRDLTKKWLFNIYSLLALEINIINLKKENKLTITN